MINFNRYINQEDNTWYDSSNIVYSKCYDTQTSDYKTLKIVFKGGRTYLYKDVDIKDYLLFKNSASTGEAFSKYIRKYRSEKIADTDLEKLQQLKEEFKAENQDQEEKKVGDIVYDIKINEESGEFIIRLNEKILFRGYEGKVSILNLFSSLNWKYSIEKVEELPNNSDENLNAIHI